MYERSARAGVWACVGTTVMAAPNRFATSLDTTTHVRVFRGSAPTEGSQQTPTTSPRRRPGASVVFIAEQVELSGLEVSQNLPGLCVLGRVVPRESGPPLGGLLPFEPGAHEVGSCSRLGLSDTLRVRVELPKRFSIKGQIYACHDTCASTAA
jgi:hypothetical protein